MQHSASVVQKYGKLTNGVEAWLYLRNQVINDSWFREDYGCDITIANRTDGETHWCNGFIHYCHLRNNFKEERCAWLELPRFHAWEHTWFSQVFSRYLQYVWSIRQTFRKYRESANFASMNWENYKDDSAGFKSVLVKWIQQVSVKQIKIRKNWTMADPIYRLTNSYYEYGKARQLMFHILKWKLLINFRFLLDEELYSKFIPLGSLRTVVQTISNIPIYFGCFLEWEDVARGLPGSLLARGLGYMQTGKELQEFLRCGALVAFIHHLAGRYANRLKSSALVEKFFFIW